MRGRGEREDPVNNCKKKKRKGSSHKGSHWAAISAKKLNGVCMHVYEGG